MNNNKVLKFLKFKKCNSVCVYIEHHFEIRLTRVYLSVVKDITIQVLIGRALGQLQTVLGEAK